MDINQIKVDRIRFVFSQGIVLFWTLWISIVTFTDFTDFMVRLAILPSNFPMISGNINLVFSFLKQYDLDTIQMAYTVYSTIILLSFIISIVSWRAFLASFNNHHCYVYRATLAFLLNAGMVASFSLIDEIFIQYQHGHIHVMRFTGVLVSFLVVGWLTERKK